MATCTHLISVSSNEDSQPNGRLPTPSYHFALNTIPGNSAPHSSISSDIKNTVSGNSTDDNSGTENLTNLEVFVQTPLRLKQTLVFYHPHAQHLPEVIDTTALLFTCELQPSLLPEVPWAPFASHSDFEQAELFIRHNYNNQLINDQLHLNQKHNHSSDAHL